MSRRFDLIICDVDGCLIAEGAEPFDLETLGHLAAHNRTAVLRGDRPIVSLCTGRPQPFAEAMCRLIHNLTAPCVCENGVWLYWPGENRYDLDPAITSADVALMRDFAAWAIETFGAVGGPAHGLAEQPGKSASVSLTHDDPAVLHEIRPALDRQVRARGWPIRISMTLRYLNCDLGHVSKGTGVRRLLARMGLPPARVAMIGDTAGDLLAAEQVGTFACPANAGEDVKRHAQIVSPYEEAHGVLDIVRQLSGA